jgi:hypothetical protein
MKQYEIQKKKLYLKSKYRSNYSAKRHVGLLRLTGIYAAAAFIIVFAVCLLINSNIVEDANPTRIDHLSNSKNALNGVIIDKKAPVASNVSNGFQISGIPADITDLAFSYDDKYCTYVYKGKLMVFNIGKNMIQKTISESSGIANSILMSSRNIIIYLTVGKLSSASKIVTVYTYNIDTDSKTVQKSITLTDNEDIFDLGYSTATSTVFFDTKSTGSKSPSDKVYYLDIMKRLHSLPLGVQIKNIVMLNKIVKFYYQGQDNILYNKSKMVKSIGNSKVELLGCDSNDTVYMQLLDSPGKILKMDSSGNIQTIKLQDASYHKVYCGQDGVYLIYSNYMINLASDPQKTTSFDKNLIFLGIGGDFLYFRDQTNNILSVKKSV